MSAPIQWRVGVEPFDLSGRSKKNPPDEFDQRGFSRFVFSVDDIESGSKTRHLFVRKNSEAFYVYFAYLHVSVNG